METLLSVEELKFYAIPFIAAFIGWLTNWIAVKMLFHPKEPINMGFFVLQGIFHRRQREIAAKLGSTIEAKLLSHEDIVAMLTSPEFVNKVLPIVEIYIDDLVMNRLANIHPMLAMVPDSMKEMLKDKLMDEFSVILPKLLQNSGAIIEEQFNVKEIVRKKIEEFEVEELEEILFSIMKSEFKMIEYVGGVLGFFIGLTQVLIVKFL